MSGQEDKFISCLKFEKFSKNLCVGTRTGVRFVNYEEPFELKCAQKLESQKIYLIELVPSTNTLIYVLDSTKNKLFFHNFSNNLEKCFVPLDPIQYSRDIILIKATNSRVIVAVEDAIFLYSAVWLDMTPLKSINLSGLISESTLDMSTHPINSYVAYPKFDRPGHCIIADSTYLSTTKVIQAHDSPLVAIAVDPHGRTVASASENGILIKVNRIFNGECVYEFRRGLTLNISITSLCYSEEGHFLCANDTTGILKIFKFAYSEAVVTKGSAWIRELFQRTAELILPEQASRILFHEDPFACAKLPESSACKTISFLHHDYRNKHHLLVANTDGLFYLYSMNIEKGGQCELLKSFNIEENRYVENAAESWVMV